MYTNPNRHVYLFPVHDFGAGAGTAVIKGPKGKRGTLIDYGVQNVSETFNAVTTPATVAVGTAANPDAFGEEFSLATVAAGDARTVRTVYDDDVAIYVDAVIVDRFIPADTKVLLTLVAPTGGTPAGIGQPFAVIDWAD